MFPVSQLSTDCASVCAVAADTNSVNTVWFVKIFEELVAEEDVVDDYGQKVNKGFAHFKGHYTEETKSVKDGCFYKVEDQTRKGKHSSLNKELFILL